jgi:hypothetical protein
VKTFEAATQGFLFKSLFKYLPLVTFEWDSSSVMQFIYSRFSMFFLFENKIVAVLILAPSLPLETAFLQVVNKSKAIWCAVKSVWKQGGSIFDLSRSCIDYNL